MFKNGKFYVAEFEKVSFCQFKKDMEKNNENIIKNSIVISDEDFEHSKMSEKEKNFYKDGLNFLVVETAHDKVKYPKRATEGSAGYDFFAPFDITIKPGESIIIPTGFRCKFETDCFVLKIYPKSGLGFKYSMGLANTVGIIDSDYYYSDNEGHIMIKLTNYNHNEDIVIKQGKSFAQGIFEIYGLTVDDDNDEKQVRNGGFGSTSK